MVPQRQAHGAIEKMKQEGTRNTKKNQRKQLSGSKCLRLNSGKEVADNVSLLLKNATKNSTS